MTEDQRSEAHLFGGDRPYFCKNRCGRPRDIGELCEDCEEESMKQEPEKSEKSEAKKVVKPTRHKCYSCNGWGTIRRSIGPRMSEYDTCGGCNGTGVIEYPSPN